MSNDNATTGVCVTINPVDDHKVDRTVDAETTNRRGTRHWERATQVIDTLRDDVENVAARAAGAISVEVRLVGFDALRLHDASIVRSRIQTELTSTLAHEGEPQATVAREIEHALNLEIADQVARAPVEINGNEISVHMPLAEGVILTGNATISHAGPPFTRDDALEALGALGAAIEQAGQALAQKVAIRTVVEIPGLRVEGRNTLLDRVDTHLAEERVHSNESDQAEKKFIAGRCAETVDTAVLSRIEHAMGVASA